MTAPSLATPLRKRRLSVWAAMVLINGISFALTAGVFVVLKGINELFDVR